MQRSREIEIAMPDSATQISRYSNVAIGLHWVIALLIPFQLALGWYMLRHRA